MRAADSAWARYEVSGDADFVTSLRGPLEANYEAWSDHYDATFGLYWQVPVWDAMEYSADSYSSQNPDGDPYHGGPGYRPTINAYPYADARALAALARLTGDPTTAETYDLRAAGLVSAMQTYLWSPQSNFFVHRYKDSGDLFAAGGGARRSASCRGSSRCRSPATKRRGKIRLRAPAPCGAHRD